MKLELFLDAHACGRTCILKELRFFKTFHLWYAFFISSYYLISESLGVDGPLHTRLFVANLAYSVDERKLREVFRLAGRVVMVELNRDKEGKSRGHAVLEFDHPVEAVQAISMFNDQQLFDRKMTVRFDKTPGPTPEELAQLPSRLPEGLGGVGMGLGSGGNPLTEVAKVIL